MGRWARSKPFDSLGCAIVSVKILELTLRHTDIQGYASSMHDHWLSSGIGSAASPRYPFLHRFIRRNFHVWWGACLLPEYYQIIGEHAR